MASSNNVKLLLLSENSSFRQRRIYVRKRKYGIRSINRNRLKYGEYHHLFSKLKQDPARFFCYTRMSPETFEYILSRIKNRLEKKRAGLQQQVKPEERLVICLRFLATGTSFRHLGFEFRLGRITISQIVFETCNALWAEFQPDVLPTPTKEHLRNVSKRFYSLWNFPNCFGTIDGKHCQLRCPPNSGSSYFNYLKYFSIVLLAVVDADKRFIVIEVGSRGNQSDGGIFVASELFKRLQRNEFNVPPMENLPNTNVQVSHVLVGDEAFPLLSYLMRPFPERILTSEREIFNTRLSRACKTVECAFGILSTKWRFLCKDIEVPSVKKASLIQTACILHNIIRDKDGIHDPDYTNISRNIGNNPDNLEPIPQIFRNVPFEAKHIRDNATHFFNQ